MNELNKPKNKIIWLVFILIVFLVGYWLISFIGKVKLEGDYLITNTNVEIKKQEKVEPEKITINIPETDGFFVELEKTKLANNQERYFSDFKETIDGTVLRGTVVLLDDIFVEGYEQDQKDYKIIPMAVNFGGSGEFFYLALFDENFNHLDSVFIDADIDPIDLLVDDDSFVFKYKSLHTSQARSEKPIVDTELNFIVKGKSIVQEEKYLNSSDSIYLLPESVYYNSEVSGKFNLDFMAKGWLFENTSTAKLFSEKMEELDQAIASSKSGEWMTSDYVEISTTLDPGDYKGKAKVVLISDNASGLPKHDKSLEFWIYIK